MAQIPTSLQTVLWSADVSHLDTAKDKEYIVHQILSRGTLKQFKWLLDTYGKEEVTRVFLAHPYKEYRKARFHFITTQVLSIHSPIDERRYVTNTPRIIG
jgi:hypothetical protein